MNYYVGSIPISDELYHHGIKGQKWGIRRYQNEDGTLTAAGKSRYVRDTLKLNKMNKKIDKAEWIANKLQNKVNKRRYGHGLLSYTDFGGPEALHVLERKYGRASSRRNRLVTKGRNMCIKYNNRYGNVPMSQIDEIRRSIPVAKRSRL